MCVLRAPWHLALGLLSGALQASAQTGLRRQRYVRELRQNEVERQVTQLERKALLAGIGEGMKLGAGEAGREARPDKKNLHSRELVRAIETSRIASP